MGSCNCTDSKILIIYKNINLLLENKLLNSKSEIFVPTAEIIENLAGGFNKELRKVLILLTLLILHNYIPLYPLHIDKIFFKAKNSQRLSFINRENVN